jgi:hypothetical protein
MKDSHPFHLPENTEGANLDSRTSGGGGNGAVYPAFQTTEECGFKETAYAC